MCQVNTIKMLNQKARAETKSGHLKPLLQTHQNGHSFSAIFFKGCFCYLFASLFCKSNNESTCEKQGKIFFHFTSEALFVLETIEF